MRRTSWSSEKLTLFGRVRVGDAGGRGGDGGGGCERGADGADGDSEGGVGEERQESFEGDVPGLPESGSVKEVVDATELRFRQLLGYRLSEPEEGRRGEGGADMVAR